MAAPAPAPTTTTHTAGTAARERTWPRLPWRLRDLRHVDGPFDVVGDVHGCHAELVELLTGPLGYELQVVGGVEVPMPPDGRTLVFVGDLVDRGPGCVEVLELVRVLVAAGRAVCVAGNHDARLADHLLRGAGLGVEWGTEATLEQLAAAAPEVDALEVARFLDSLPAHAALAGGRLVVSHAGVRAAMLADIDGVPEETDEARTRALHGEFEERRAACVPLVRCFRWLEEERPFELAYGHTVVDAPTVSSRAMNLDTGCVYGGSLSALRWPEGTTHSVRAHATHWL